MQQGQQEKREIKYEMDCLQNGVGLDGFTGPLVTHLLYDSIKEAVDLDL